MTGLLAEGFLIVADVVEVAFVANATIVVDHAVAEDFAASSAVGDHFLVSPGS